MDFELTEDQTAITQALGVLLDQRAGPARAIVLHRDGEYDRELDGALADGGFLAMVGGEETGPLEAALLVEAVARWAGVVAVGAGALVAPGLLGEALAGPVALVRFGSPGPVRYAAHARNALVHDGNIARVVCLEGVNARPVRSNFGYPMAEIEQRDLEGGRLLGAGSGERLLDWWRLALALEAVGCMRAALDCTVAYLQQRRQFGRAIGSFQAVQHRLATCAIQVEGSRWLAYEAAHQAAPREATATALAYTMGAASLVFKETHQLSGAIGFTREHDLHVWSMRLHALNLELGGLGAQRRAVCEARWGGPA